MIDRAKLVKLLDARRGDRAWKALAAEIGCSEAYLSDIRKGKRNPGPKILEFLGLRKVERYEEQRERYEEQR